MLFLDEIHRMARPAEEMLYIAMEDFRVDVVVGKGPGATAIPLDVPPFTLVGATTRAGLLPAPLRDRFGFAAHMDFYEPAELEQMLHRSARLLGVRARPTAAPPRSPAGPAARRGSPTGCCAGSATTPRCAPTAWSPWRSRRAALRVYEVDELGLDRLDRAVLDALVAQLRRRPGRAVHPRGRRRGGAARRSRRSPSRSWSGRGCWPARPAAGWRRRPPGPTSG